MYFSPTKKAALSGGLLLAMVFYFLVVTPPLAALYGTYNSQRIVELTSLTLLCLLYPPRQFPAGPMGIAFTGFIMTGLVSTALSTNPGWAAIEYLRFALLFSLAFSIANAGERKLLGYTYALATIALTMLIKISIGIYVVHHLGGGIAAVADGFSNHRHFAEFFVALQTLFALLLLGSQRRLIRYAALAPLAVSTIIILMGSGRASATALAVGALVYIYLNSTRRLYAAIMAISGVTLGWAVYYFLLTMPESFLARPQDSGRFSLWAIGFKSWLDNPVFGIGPMQFASIPNDIAAHPHNSAIQFLCEWGLAGLLLVASFFASWLSLTFRPDTYGSHRIAISATAAVTGLLVSSMFGGVFVVPAVELLFFVLLGISMTSDSIKWSRSRFAAMGTRVFAISICVLSLLSWGWQTSDTPRGAPVDAPRFWQDGRLPIYKMNFKTYPAIPSAL